MKSLVPVPKSKIRDQGRLADGLTQVAIVKSCRFWTMPFGNCAYSPSPDRLSAPLPISPGMRGPVAPVLVTAVIVRVSAFGPVPIWTLSPTFNPVVPRRLTVLAPAFAGTARPDAERPSR